MRSKNDELKIGKLNSDRDSLKKSIFRMFLTEHDHVFQINMQGLSRANS